MLKFVPAAILAAAMLTSARAEEASGPSFDCAKAASATEHAICDAPMLGWYDRQMAKSWKVVTAALGDKDLAPVKKDQAAFLKSRDACLKTDDSYDCLANAYLARIRTLTALLEDEHFRIASYGSENGGVDMARYPDDTAALTISTIGGGDHTCGFETDNAVVDDAGTLTWSEKPDPAYAEACTIKGTVKGKTLTIEATGDGCTYYCGVRAELSGTFTAKD